MCIEDILLRSNVNWPNDEIGGAKEQDEQKAEAHNEWATTPNFHSQDAEVREQGSL